MKTRSKIWLVFLIVGIICAIITRCKNAKAEGWDPWSGDPWQEPSWLTSEDPFDSPAPLPSPTPKPDPSNGLRGTGEGEGTRGVPNDGQYGNVRYKAGYWTRLMNGNQATIRWKDVWGGSTVFNPTGTNPWCLFINDGTLIQNQVFENTRSYTNTNGIYPGNTDASDAGIDFSVTYAPNSAEVLNNEMQFEFSCRWNVSASLEADPNAAYTFEDLNINYSEFQNYVPVTVFYLFCYNDNGTDKYLWIRDDIWLNDLASYSHTFNSSDIPDDLYIKSVTVHIVVNYDSYKNYIVNLVKSWYYNYDPTLVNIPYPQIVYNAKNVINAKLKITYTENAKNRSWLLRVLQSLFLPDPDQMADIFNSFLGDPSVGGSSIVIGMREILYNHMTDNNNAGEAIINMPEINIPLGNNNTAHIFDGYTFNLTEFYNGNTIQSGAFRTLTRGVQFIISALMFSAFFQSLWSMISHIFGLHLWQGVNGEDIADVVD
ncbi:MAG: hypothetical protein K5768_04100 [Firmicutes bacterium]|nr:hypothetical protein [Bacillota bacterium]